MTTIRSASWNPPLGIDQTGRVHSTNKPDKIRDKHESRNRFTKRGKSKCHAYEYIVQVQGYVEIYTKRYIYINYIYTYIICLYTSIEPDGARCDKTIDVDSINSYVFLIFTRYVNLTATSRYISYMHDISIHVCVNTVGSWANNKSNIIQSITTESNKPVISR